MTTTRCIATRIQEAVRRDVAAGIAANTRMAPLYDGRVYSGVGPSGPKGLNIVTRQVLVFGDARNDFTAGVTQRSDVEYDVEVAFFFPPSVLFLSDGDYSYHDDITTVRAFLYAGGTAPNKSGRLLDPDWDGISQADTDKWITLSIVRCQQGSYAWGPNGAYIVVPVVFTFMTRENAQGARA